MNIAIVCYPTFGGSGVVATELGVALARKGHQVHFITYSYPVRLDFLEMNIHFHEVHVEEYPLFHYQPYELALSSKMAYVVKTYNIDILHVHYAIPHAYAGYMAKQMLKREGIEVPMVTTLHGTDITLVGNHPTYKEAVTFSINESDVVTSVSESLKQDTLRLFNVHKDIKVIASGGAGKGEKISEAEAIKRELIKNGIDETRIIKEDKSKSTIENLKFSLEKINENRVANNKNINEKVKVLIVTNGYHLYRSKKTAELFGYEAYGLPAKTPLISIPKSYLREFLSIIKLISKIWYNMTK